VWTVSAIATTLVHAGAIWWGVNAWQQQRPTFSPTPIQVIALPAAATTEFEPTPPATTDASPIASEVPVDANTTASPVEPVAPSDSGPPPQAAVPAAELGSPPQSSPPSAPVPVEPVTHTPPSAPIPPSSPPPSTAESSPPVRPAPGEPSPAAPPGSSESPAPSGSGVQAFWTLQTVPGGSDLPEEWPEIPPNWRESTSVLLANSRCATGLVPPGTSVRVTLWPIVEADGRISEFLSWDGRENVGKEAVIDCVEQLGPQMAPLIPAKDGGAAIASYAMLLVVEVQGIP
jgi:hypothetical protein